MFGFADHKGKRNIGSRIVRPNVIVFIGYGHGDGIGIGVRLNVTGNRHRIGIEAVGSISLRGTRVSKRITVRGRFRELRFFYGKLNGRGGSCRIVIGLLPGNGYGIVTGCGRGICRTVFFACISRAGIDCGQVGAFHYTDYFVVFRLTAVSPIGNRYIDRLFGFGYHKGKRNIGISIVRPNVIVFIGYGHGDGIVAGVRLNVTGNRHRSGIESVGSIGLRGTRVSKRITVRGRFRELRFFDGKRIGLGFSCRIVLRFFPGNG